jgi:hypothetical protein
VDRRNLGDLKEKESQAMYKRLLATILSVSMVIGTVNWGTVKASVQASSPETSTPDQQALEKLLAPIALYPDALLAQVLACAGSPQQVTEVNKWLNENTQLKGTELQEAAETAGFDASFIAMVLFPDVLTFLEQNLEWTTEVGTAFTSDQTAVLDSVQRLRSQAEAAGNLKTTSQQEVKTETQNGQTVIVVQPANPQVVYVPQYNPQTVYTAPPPAEDDSSDVVAAAVIGFTVGILLGAAMNDNYGYYGWGGWGMHWHSHTVVVRGSPWRVPPGRYPYARPRPGYRPNVNVNAPRYNNINANVNNPGGNRRNVNTNTGARTPRPTTMSAGSPQGRQTTTSAPRTATPSRTAGNANRGRTGTASGGTASPAMQSQRGSATSAFSGYKKGSSSKTASQRGRSSSGSRSGRGRSRR